LSTSRPPTPAAARDAGPLEGVRGAHHIGLSVSDLPAMIDWYRDALGFALELRFEIPGGQISGAMLRRPEGTGLELLAHRESTAQQLGDPHRAMLVQGYGHWALAVADVPGVHAALLAAGAREVWSPRPAPPPARGTMSYLADPEGNLIELVEP
jgi:catechol 2,3-dioxygenase-like lactoylglutathione lyase family enzyme